MGDEKKNDLKKVKELVDLMIENDLVEVEIVDGDSKIHLKRPGHSQPMQAMAPMHIMAPAAASAAGSAVPAADDKLVDIKSPIIGTFYAAPSPDSAPYVKVGDHVTPDTVVCIIEAMKVMNEIKAETTGTIEKVMIANGQVVEFGQVIFKVRPD
ncbi:MAG: acetyl-CoA carboxylase biotin carboxyl carrier protein [Phycisphaerae bacterium]|jgi:acetyl-CoA carboxylase biotin carboxyl carrier protein